MNSVLQQSYANIRLVVFDNSSNEKTSELAKKYTDQRMEYHRSAYGVSAVEHGLIVESFLALNKEDYNCIFFDDDIMCHNHIRDSIDNINNSGMLISASPVVGIDSSGKLLPYDIGPKIKYFAKACLRGLPGIIISCRKNPIISPTLVWKREITMNRSSLFFQSAGYNDYSFNIHLIYNYGIALLQNPTIKLRIHPGQDGNNYRDDSRYWHRLARWNGLCSLGANKIIIYSIELSFRLIDFVEFLARKVFKNLILMKVIE